MREAVVTASHFLSRSLLVMSKIIICKTYVKELLQINDIIILPHTQQKKKPQTLTKWHTEYNTNNVQKHSVTNICKTTYKLGQRKGWAVRLAHKEPFQDNLVELGIGTSSQESVQLHKVNKITSYGTADKNRQNQALQILKISYMLIILLDFTMEIFSTIQALMYLKKTGVLCCPFHFTFVVFADTVTDNYVPSIQDWFTVGSRRIFSDTCVKQEADQDRQQIRLHLQQHHQKVCQIQQQLLLFG